MASVSASRAKIAMAFVFVSIVWGSTYYGIRLALESFPPFLIGALRFLSAGAVLYVALRLRGERAPTRREWGSALVTGLLFFIVGNGFVNVAELSLSSGLTSVLVATMPLWATVFARLGGERASRYEWTGIVLGLVGVVVLNLGGELRASGSGALFGLSAPMGWALGSVASKRLPLPSGAMAAASQMITGGAAMLLVSLVLGERFPSSPSLAAVVAVAYLALFGSLLGFSAYGYLLRHTSAAVATSYAYVNPIIAVALGVGLARERLDLASGLGAVVVLGAVLLITRTKARGLRAGSPGRGKKKRRRQRDRALDVCRKGIS